MSDFNLGETLSTKSLPLKANQNQPRETLKLSIKENPAQNSEDITPPSSGTSPTDALPDFDNAPLPEDETAEAIAPVGEGAEGKITPTGMITYEIFDDGFVKAFQLGGHLSGLQSLVMASEQPARPDATRAMYDIILDTPSLHFLLKPSSLWMQRILAIGMFAVPVAAGVAQELKEKQAARRPAPQNSAQEPPADASASMRAALKGKKA